MVLEGASLDRFHHPDDLGERLSAHLAHRAAAMKLDRYLA
jgi:hypothetical protein